MKVNYSVELYSSTISVHILINKVFIESIHFYLNNTVIIFYIPMLQICYQI